MTTNGFQKLRTEVANGEIDVSKFASIVDSLRTEFNKGTTKNVEWRRKQLQQIELMVEENTDLIANAVRQDLGGSNVRALGDFGAHGAAGFALSNLNSWTADEKVTTPFLTCPTRLASSYIRREPKGVMLLIAPWNYPVDLCFGPLVSAIAAGNCVVIKPSEVSTHCAKVIEQLVTKYLDPACVKVVQGAVPETTALLKLHWDHIFFTGNGAVGKIVMRAASDHLTPVTLELGGKSPCIVDKTARLDVVTNRVSFFKWWNVGQTCIAPDYIIVHEDRKEELIKALVKDAEAQFGADPKKSKDLGRVISDRHVTRIADLVRNTKGRVVIGGVDTVDAENRFFPPTILLPEDLDQPILKEEIFGPVLPIVTYKNDDEILKIVHKVCDKPLAFYIFSQNKAFQQKLLAGSQSGGVGINTCVEQYSNAHLPFGGTGSSGMGCSHGKWGFDEFTHKRSVIDQDSLIKRDGPIPPFPHPGWLYDVFLRASVKGFVPRAYRGAVSAATKLSVLCVLLLAVKKIMNA